MADGGAGGADRTAAEFFAGIGLVAAGLKPSGWRVGYANDIDPGKRRLHELLFGPAPHYHLGDVRDADGVLARLGEPPLLATASFPCVDLSTAGRYRGFGGEHSSTFFAFAEVLRRLGPRRPALVLLENVPGFVTARGGADFAAAAAELAGLGYRLDACVADACRFVPQSRPRVFMVGRRADRFPAAGAAAPPEGDARPERLRRAMAAIRPAHGWDCLPLPPFPSRTVTLEEVIDADDGQDWWSADRQARHLAMAPPAHRERLEGLAREGRRFVGTAFRRVRAAGQQMEVRFDGLAGCLRTPRGGSGRQIVAEVADGRLRLRWMNPAEYARLQGYAGPLPAAPTGSWLFAFGDAVCVPVVSWVDRHLLSPGL